jgi:hypothetical protein
MNSKHFYIILKHRVFTPFLVDVGDLLHLLKVMDVLGFRDKILRSTYS